MAPTRARPGSPLSVSLARQDVLLEVCLDRASVAAEAERAGAERLEVCADLSLDGLTPSAELIAEVKAICSLPIVAMVRPRPSEFRLDSTELAEMHRDLEALGARGVDGFVFGILTQQGEIPTQELGALLEAAQGLPVTFHRAFDHCAAPQRALQQLAALGFRRVLTSGRPGRAIDHLELLSELGQSARALQEAGTAFDLLPGGGVRAPLADLILAASGAKELHSSATEGWYAWRSGKA